MPKEGPPTISAILESLKQGRKPGWLDEKELLGRFNVKKPIPPAERITEKNIDDFEKQTIEVTSRAIFVLEDALSKWEALKEKPADLVPEYEKYKGFHDKLVEWAEKILRSRAKGDELDFYARVDRLLEYSRICKEYK